MNSREILPQAPWIDGLLIKEQAYQKALSEGSVEKAQQRLDDMRNFLIETQSLTPENLALFDSMGHHETVQTILEADRLTKEKLILDEARKFDNELKKRAS